MSSQILSIFRADTRPLVPIQGRTFRLRNVRGTERLTSRFIAVTTLGYWSLHGSTLGHWAAVCWSLPAFIIGHHTAALWVTTILRNGSLQGRAMVIRRLRY